MKTEKAYQEKTARTIQQNWMVADLCNLSTTAQ